MAIRTTNWMKGINYEPSDDRSLISGLVVTPGADTHRSFIPSQTPTPSMKARVSSGHAFVNGSRVAHQGMYHVYNDGNIDVDINPSDPTRDRLDLISLIIEDLEYTTIVPSLAKIVVTSGIPASTPVLPNSPPDSIDIGSVRVKKGVSTITNADIQVLTPRATALGGIAYARNYMEMTEKLPRIDGLHVYRKDIDRLMVCDGSTWNYINTKPSRDTGWMNINIATKYQAQPTKYRVYGDMVFTRGGVKEYQKNKKNVNKWNVIGTINKSYAPPSTVQVQGGLNSTVKQGVEFHSDGNVYLYYQAPTGAWTLISTSWLLG